MIILKLYIWILVIFNELLNYGDFDYKKKMNLKELIVKVFIIKWIDCEIKKKKFFILFCIVREVFSFIY